MVIGYWLIKETFTLIHSGTTKPNETVIVYRAVKVEEVPCLQQTNKVQDSGKVFEGFTYNPKEVLDYINTGKLP